MLSCFGTSVPKSCKLLSSSAVLLTPMPANKAEKCNNVVRLVLKRAGHGLNSGMVRVCLADVKAEAASCGSPVCNLLHTGTLRKVQLNAWRS